MVDSKEELWKKVQLIYNDRELKGVEIVDKLEGLLAFDFMLATKELIEQELELRKEAIEKYFKDKEPLPEE